MNSLNFIGGEKGGVGKSVVSRVLAQYLIDQQRPFVGFDTDRSHTTFTRFYRDFASPVIVDSYESLDAIAQALVNAHGEVHQSVIVDLAAQTATPLARWIDDSELLPLMAEMGVTVNFWHVADAGKIFRLEGPTGIRLKIKDLHQARAVARQLAPSLPLGMGIRDWTQQNRTWFAAVQVEKRMMFIILTLIVAVAAFNLVSTLVMTVTDKRADIAILRTLGASPKSIMGVFMVQGALVGIIGTLGGMLLGLLIAFNIDVIVPALEAIFQASFLPKDIYLISRMPSDPQMSDILPVVLISLMLSFVATLYPSWRASQVNPAEALRYE
jgi:lipoprotein releasing system LolC/E family transmembrane protein